MARWSCCFARGVKTPSRSVSRSAVAQCTLLTCPPQAPLQHARAELILVAQVLEANDAVLDLARGAEDDEARQRLDRELLHEKRRIEHRDAQEERLAVQRRQELEMASVTRSAKSRSSERCASEALDERCASASDTKMTPTRQLQTPN